MPSFLEQFDDNMNCVGFKLTKKKEIYSMENVLKPPKERWHLLDNLRGVCIILVVLYHVLYNLSDVFGGNYAFFTSNGMNNFRDGFVSVLVALSGISCSLSRSNLKRGIKTLLCGLLITVVMAIFMPDSLIVFGILHFLGVAMLIYALFGKFIAKIPAFIGVPIFLLLFFFTKNLMYGKLGLFGLFEVVLTEVPQNIVLFILGFDVNIFSADYYPLMPWLFMFLAGVLVGKYFKNGTAPQFFKKNLCPPLSFLGRHTLIIYLLHQPLIYGVMYLLFVVFKV